MKLIGICRSCNGDGYTRKFLFLRRECSICSGTGRHVQTLQEYKSQ